MSGYKSGMKGADVVALLKNGLPIVNDVSELDPNAELGSMASVVTPGSIQETSFRNLYQPDASMLDQATGTLTQPELLSSVSSVKVFAPADINNIGFEPVQSMIALATRDFSLTSQNLAMIQIEPSVGVMVMTMTMTGGYDTMQQFRLVEFSQDTMSYTVHNDQVEAFNAVLANGMDWCYLSSPESGFVITEEQFDTIDLFCMAVAGVPSITDIYVKGDKWEKLYEKEFTQLNSTTKVLRDGVIGLQTQVSAIKTSYPIVNTTESNVRMQPNTYYKCSASNNLTLTFDFSGDTTTVREYVIEINCQTSFTLSLTYVVKWANEIVPVIEAGKTIVISVVNNLAVFAEFV